MTRSSIGAVRAIPSSRKSWSYRPPTSLKRGHWWSPPRKECPPRSATVGTWRTPWPALRSQQQWQNWNYRRPETAVDSLDRRVWTAGTATWHTRLKLARSTSRHPVCFTCHQFSQRWTHHQRERNLPNSSIKIQVMTVVAGFETWKQVCKCSTLSLSLAECTISVCYFQPLDTLIRYFQCNLVMLVDLLSCCFWNRGYIGHLPQNITPGLREKIVGAWDEL